MLLNTDNGPVFAQLYLIFTIMLSGNEYAVALVQAFDWPAVVPPNLQRKDQDLGFYRLQQRKELQIEFVWAESIIHGAVIVPAYDKPDHSLVFDIVDADLAFRVKEMKNL